MPPSGASREPSGNSSDVEPADPQRFRRGRKRPLGTAKPAPGARSGDNAPVTPLLAEAYADKVIMDALERFAPIAAVALVFGLFYWLYRRRAVARETEKRGE